MFTRISTKIAAGNYEANIAKLNKVLCEADAVVIGAGAGLSTSAGFTYSGERFKKYFSDFAEKYGIRDMYSGGFYPFPNEETYWAWWSRNIWVNRYVPIPSSVYSDLLLLVEEKDYFVLTTNVDHCFQKAGFDKKRLFYTQGDYGLLQSIRPKVMKTYDNEEIMRKMLLAQGFEIEEDGTLTIPEGVTLKTEIPTELIPVCPDDGSKMTTNLRVDNYFCQDKYWELASERYSEFIRRHKNLHVLYLELGVGMNTPVIIKYPFWRYTNENPDAVYACINYGEAVAPREIEKQSICINGDIGEVLKELKIEKKF